MAASQHAGSAPLQTSGHLVWPLLKAAFAAIIDPTTASCVAPGSPLVLVCETDLSRLLDDLRMACLASLPRRAVLLEGHALAAAVSRGDDGEKTHLLHDLAGLHLLIIRGIDQVGPAGTQRAVAGLLDGLATAGVTVCASLGRPPGVARLEPSLASRLAAGLVLHVPSPSLAVRADDPSPDRWSVGQVMRATASRHGLTATDLVGPQRTRSMVHVRNLAMYLSRRFTGRSFDAIGSVFGGRDHTTVMRGIRSVETRLRNDVAFAGDLERLIADLGCHPGHRRRRPRRRATG